MPFCRSENRKVGGVRFKAVCVHVEKLQVTELQPPPSDLQIFPLPPSLKRRLCYVALMYVVLMCSLLAVIWAMGSDVMPWMIAAIIPAIVSGYLVRKSAVTVHVPSDGRQPTAAEVDAEFAAVTSPFTPQLIGLVVLVVVASAGTAIIAMQSAVPDSPELVTARMVCGAAWQDFETIGDSTTQQSWTTCLIRNPALASSCGLSAKLADAILGAESISDVTLNSTDLTACGKDLF